MDGQAEARTEGFYGLGLKVACITLVTFLWLELSCSYM